MVAWTYNPGTEKMQAGAYSLEASLGYMKPHLKLKQTNKKHRSENSLEHGRLGTEATVAGGWPSR